MPLIFCRRERRGGLRRRPCDGLLCTSDRSRRAQVCRGTVEGICGARWSEGGRFFPRRSRVGGAGEGGCENSERRGGGGRRNVVVNILWFLPSSGLVWSVLKLEHASHSKGGLIPARQWEEDPRVAGGALAVENSSVCPRSFRLSASCYPALHSWVNQSARRREYAAGDPPDSSVLRASAQSLSPPPMSPNSTLPRKRLRVSIGPDRFHQVVASVNGLPTEIDTPLFVGRVLVLVKDFDGVTPDGSPPITEHTYFHGRSRKFAILVEGRFKAREGVAPYTGEEVQFGSDFGVPDAEWSARRWWEAN